MIELLYDCSILAGGYEELKSHVALTEILQRYQASGPAKQLELTFAEGVLYVKDFGKRSAKCCL